ncbi:MAG: biopolymer transporter ExbD [Candidatus Omnitrophica bacterium]|nr:biopolymer transporter ExbD [Candidatus Omnitrophota bacterium]
MVPLIDMFFILLVFFIFGVFSMTMQEGIRVNLPSAQTAVSSREEPVTISLTVDGALFLDQEAVTLSGLSERLRQVHAVRPDALVVLNADRQVAHGTVVETLDAIRQAGLQRVSFQTAPAEAAAQ